MAQSHRQARREQIEGLAPSPYGVGRFAVEAVINRWYDAVMGVALLWAAVFVVVNLLIDTAYAGAEKIITEHWDRVEAIAEALLKYETLQGEEVERIVRGERLDKPTVADLLEKEAAKTARPTKTPPASDQGDQELAAGGDVMPSPA